MNYACVTVADLRFPAAYLNQMDHQHKVCREGWFVFRMPPGIYQLNAIVICYLMVCVTHCRDFHPESRLVA